MSNERQQKYRLNRDKDPFRCENYLIKERERGKKNLRVKDMNDRELRKHRRKCRKRKQKQQEGIKAMEKGLLTPWNSPDDQPHEYDHEIRPRPRRAKRSHVKYYEKNRLLINLFSKEKRRVKIFRKRHERLAKSQKTHKRDSPWHRTDKLIDTKSSNLNRSEEH